MLLLLCLLLQTGYTVSQSTIRAAEGQSVTLPCRYAANEKEVTSMCWGLGACPMFGCSSEFIETDGQKVTWTKGSRYQLKGDIQRGDVSLTIEGARPSDSGIYCCRVEHPGWGNDQKETLSLMVDSDLVTQIPTSHTSSSLKSVKSPEGAHPTQVTVSNLYISVQSAAGFSDHHHRPHNQSTQNSALMHPGDRVQESQKTANSTVYVLVPVLLLTLAALAAGVYVRHQKTNKMFEQGRPLPIRVLEPGGHMSALERPNHAEDNVYIME